MGSQPGRASDSPAIQAVVFDAYGTLFDVHSAVAREASRVGDGAARLSETWRSKQLQYTWLRSLMGRWVNFEQVTAEALDFALDQEGISDDGLRQALLTAYDELACYPELPAVLATLGAAGVRTAILSNGSRRMLDAAVAHAGIGDQLAAVLSVDEVGVFKPDPRVYQLAVDRLAVQADEILFVSANGWDAAGASTFGFRVAWVNRGKQAPERLPGGIATTLSSLDDIPALAASWRS